MKYQVLFSLKNNEEIFMKVVCCSCDWPFKGYKCFGLFSVYHAQSHALMFVLFCILCIIFPNRSGGGRVV